MENKVIRDPLHNLISLAPIDDRHTLRVHRLMDTREFQRLRRIRQLGVSWFTYPGAEHSRFIHSIGVYHLARRIITALGHSAEPDIADELRDHTAYIVSAALLHDIGHGPFSHVFERVFDGPPHENWTVEILRSPNTEIHQALLEQGMSPEAIVDIIEERYPVRYAVDIVSSQLDADRMDYLLRDALMTGVQYGAYDVDWLINSLRIAPIKLGDTEYLRLCVDGSKGVHAIEQYILARLFMYMQVYFHRTTRATEALITNMFALATDLAGRNKLPDTTPAAVREMLTKKGRVDIETYLRIDDFTMVNALAVWAEANSGRSELQRLSNMCDTFLNRRRPYRCIELTRTGMLNATKLVQDLVTRDDALRYHCHLDMWDERPFKDIVYNLGGKEIEDALNLTLFVVGHDGSGRPIESRSEVLSSLRNAEVEISRFFYDGNFEREFERLFAKFGVKQ